MKKIITLFASYGRLKYILKQSTWRVTKGMPIKIYNSQTNELLGELKSYTISHPETTNIDIIWGIWVDAPFSDPKEQKEAFTVHEIGNDGKEVIFEEGWLKDVSGTRPNIAIKIVGKKKE
jgi:hypothetical protein